jgi:hypothetical protein
MPDGYGLRLDASYGTLKVWCAYGWSKNGYSHWLHVVFDFEGVHFIV